MTQAHVLDKLIGASSARVPNAADVAAFEATPYAERIAAQSTYEALQLGAARDPDAPAIHFLPNADPGEPPLTLSYAQFMARRDAGGEHVPRAGRRPRRRGELPAAAAAAELHRRCSARRPPASPTRSIRCSSRRRSPRSCARPTPRCW